jgi:predicted TIM-barrel fold metal-dependent hydrolase
MEEIIDIHVHFGAPYDPASGCYWSETFEKTAAYWFMKLMSGSLFKKLTIAHIEKKLLEIINDSKQVDKCVLLAMDKVYDENGNPKDNETHLYVPNTYIKTMSENNTRVLFGASVHPYKTNWKNELENCIHNGACLCKWIPSSQQIDPTNNKCIPFYQALADHDLPLLVHCGPEYAIPTSNKNYIEMNNPKYLRSALNMGVTVIIAHCSLPYLNMLDIEYQDDLAEFYKLFEDAQTNNWKLYSDVSALATPLRSSYIPDVKRKIPHEKLLFGSDYPLPASELSYKKSKNVFKWLKLFFEALSTKNPIDKNYLSIDDMGFNKSVFTNASNLFNAIIR